MIKNDLKWHLEKSCEPKKLKNVKKVRRGQTNQRTDRPTKRGVELRSMQLKISRSLTSAPGDPNLYMKERQQESYAKADREMNRYKDSKPIRSCNCYVVTDIKGK